MREFEYFGFKNAKNETKKKKHINFNGQLSALQKNEESDKEDVHLYIS